MHDIDRRVGSVLIVTKRRTHLNILNFWVIERQRRSCRLLAGSWNEVMTVWMFSKCGHRSFTLVDIAAPFALFFVLSC